MTQPYTGGCACGAIRYQINGEPLLQNHCQCLDCQHSSGTGHGPYLTFARNGVHHTGTAGQVRRERLDARNRTINRVRARVEHVYAGLSQLGGKLVRAMTLARNELAITLKCVVYNARRWVWLTENDPA